MQISTNQFYNTSNSLMSQLTEQADKLQTQISTGKRLQDPSDDAVAYQQLQLLARQTSNDSAYQANVATAQSLLTQSDSTLTSVVSQIQRAQELAVEANSGSLDDDQRSAISTELRGIISSLVGLANTTNAHGTPLFAGSQGTQPVTQNADGSVTINDTGTATSIPIGESQTVVANDTASDVFGGIDTGSGTTDLFSILNSFADALDAGGTAASDAASTAGDALTAALSHVSDAQASVGAREKRLDLVSSAMTDMAVTRETQRSSLEDTDVTQAITDLQKTMTILQATQASFTKLTSLSLFDYLK
ncbi:flagellar hook-associated protein FlgL [Hephaestia mangrovi]|uniref:flagellar hook-associated protein FlgL n=1 Tax=Hephaestia mangrovi TaxID=2873268 RepID=UPI001CA70AF8|nr:flagellar hook-associated protein FlgL [Hephaestia mangrovi]MBY8829285.1 flagellar hook-associated protein FlgL [Hephaestia mangrovi]